MKFNYGLYAEVLFDDDIEAESEEEAMELIKRRFIEDLYASGEEIFTRFDIVIKEDENDSIFDYIKE